MSHKNIYDRGGQLAARINRICGSRLIKKTKQYLLIKDKIPTIKL